MRLQAALKSTNSIGGLSAFLGDSFINRSNFSSMKNSLVAQLYMRFRVLHATALHKMGKFYSLFDRIPIFRNAKTAPVAQW